MRRALEDWPKINFLDDREGCLFMAIVERVKVQEIVVGARLREGNGPINDVQGQILVIIQEIPRIPYEALANRLEISRNTVKRHIQQLKSQGLLRRFGSKKKGGWEVIPRSAEK